MGHCARGQSCRKKTRREPPAACAAAGQTILPLHTGGANRWRGGRPRPLGRGTRARLVTRDHPFPPRTLAGGGTGLLGQTTWDRRRLLPLGKRRSGRGPQRPRGRATGPTFRLSRGGSRDRLKNRPTGLGSRPAYAPDDPGPGAIVYTLRRACCATRWAGRRDDAGGAPTRPRGRFGRRIHRSRGPHWISRPSGAKIPPSNANRQRPLAPIGLAAMSRGFRRAGFSSSRRYPSQLKGRGLVDCVLAQRPAPRQTLPERRQRAARAPAPAGGAVHSRPGGPKSAAPE